MNDLDQLILQTLQADGRAPFSAIARQAGVSATTVRLRYQNLVRQGILRTVGIADPYAMGFQAPALIAIAVEPGAVEQVAQQIGELPEVSYLVMTLGAWDLMVEVFCRDLVHLSELILQHIHRIPGVRTTEALMIARSYKLSYRWSPYATGVEGDPGSTGGDSSAQDQAWLAGPC
jgi:Lrp/AsnC family transcriptional regulator for asnA, asnC and gidA